MFLSHSIQSLNNRPPRLYQYTRVAAAGNFTTARVSMRLPSGIDQRMMLLSFEPDARMLPSGLNDTDAISPE